MIKNIQLGPQGERDAFYMRDPWYGYSTSVLKNKGFRGIPEWHNNVMMHIYKEVD